MVVYCSGNGCGYCYQGMVNFRYYLVGIVMLLGSCSTPPLAPVVEKSVLTNRQEVEPIGGELIRIIQPGDTLYSIAFVLGLDVNELAAWNGLSDKSRILAGQRLRLTKPIGFDKQVSLKAIQQNKTGQLNKNTRPNETTLSATSSSVPSLSKSSSQVPAPTISRNTAAVSQSNIKKQVNVNQVSWSWPTTGRVITGFNLSAGKQGVDIRGNEGQAVYSAASGEVVYVGNGLKGYGNLIIIKHNAHYLSAYAHNAQLFVVEGKQVLAREKIATVGANGSRGHLLHFQIRLDGKPVNPIKYLPKNS